MASIIPTICSSCASTFSSLSLITSASMSSIGSSGIGVFLRVYDRQVRELAGDGAALAARHYRSRSSRALSWLMPLTWMRRFSGLEM